MTENQMLGYSFTIAGTLLMIIWLIMRTEQKRNVEALDKKASNDALEDVKSHHRDEIERLERNFTDRLREVHQRQDREIDWLKQETSEIKQSLTAMRSEQNAANALITQNIQQLSLIIQRGRRNEP